jgi:hypothetical protein
MWIIRATTLAVVLSAAKDLGLQPRFRSSLTATVNLPTERGSGESERDGTVVPASAPAGLRCSRVTLRWRELAGARRYVVYVSVRGDGPWAPLPARNVCGDTRPAGATGLVDVEPAAGAPAVARRLYYKVFALAGADAPPLDVTDPVVVEFP